MELGKGYAMSMATVFYSIYKHSLDSILHNSDVMHECRGKQRLH